MKRYIMAVIVLLSLLNLRCGDTGEETEKKFTIGYSTPALSNAFWVRVRDGAQEAADSLDVNLIVYDAQRSITKQLADVEDFVQQKVDAVLISPFNSKAIIPAVEAANAGNVPVIIVDIGAEGGEYETFIISDNKEGGRIAGEYIADKINGSGKVVLIRSQAGYPNTELRGDGFTEVMNEKGIEIIAEQRADSRRDLGMSVMDDILEAHSDIDAVFCVNDEMAMGALVSLENAGREKEVVLVGFDGNADAVEAIKNGRLSATVAQEPEVMGKIGVESAVKVLNGEKLDKEIFVPIYIITQNNN